MRGPGRQPRRRREARNAGQACGHESRGGGGGGGGGDPTPAQAVGALLDGVLSELGVADKIRECQALLAWEEVAGPRLAEHARAMRVQRGRLQLAVPSAVWRTHLSFSKQQLVERINQRLGRRVIRDLVFVNRPLPAGDGSVATDERSPGERDRTDV